MQAKASEKKKLILGIVVSIVALGFVFYGVFDKSAHVENRSFFYVIVGIAFGRLAVLLLRKTKQKI